jgi:hypothetical protein
MIAGTRVETGVIQRHLLENTPEGPEGFEKAREPDGAQGELPSSVRGAVPYTSITKTQYMTE